ncbi:UNVERIFIED_CONTAM: hypothetical protein Slati_3358800 [Sesamum latifolium]|uniref:Endonuclease/exonuclease/phosphatase domain-containing protein n=1 Tax=Sesamum latifolium TaxID=2727402 RepID=A0AAW2UD98_9LAMI
MDEGLSTVASGRDGGESPCRVDVEYEWVPPKCNACCSLGHRMSACPTMQKSHKPPISVYVQRPKHEAGLVRAKPMNNPQPSKDQLVQPPAAQREQWSPSPIATLPDNRGKGKKLVLYNSFDLLINDDDVAECSTRGPIQRPHNGYPIINAAIWNVRGLNRRDHQVAVADLVLEFRLQFLGLLETRVNQANVTHVQLSVLPRWKWFTDPLGPGNRIWIAWDDDLLNVDILDIDTTKSTVTLVTIVYGADEVGIRRELWQVLGTLARRCVDNFWLVAGDFNAVRDLSEVCGTSGDIRLAMEEFNDCIMDTGLITLLMQGELFTWHNGSTDACSLWKRLDRLLVNDRWIEQWPNTLYLSLTHSTSDHSLLVLRGDTQHQPGGIFRFGNYLATSPDFIPSVQNVWRHTIVGTSMYAVTRKLKALKPVFREQRRRKGDLSNNVKLAKDFLEIA